MTNDARTSTEWTQNVRLVVIHLHEMNVSPYLAGDARAQFVDRNWINGILHRQSLQRIVYGRVQADGPNGSSHDAMNTIL